MQKNKRDDFTEKVVAGLKLAFERFVEEKRKNDSVLVVKRDGKIVYLKPDEL